MRVDSFAGRLGEDVQGTQIAAQRPADSSSRLASEIATDRTKRKVLGPSWIPGSRELPRTEQARIGSSEDRAGWLPIWLIRLFQPALLPLPHAIYGLWRAPDTDGGVFAKVESPKLFPPLAHRPWRFRPSIEDRQPRHHPAASSSWTLAELDREAMKNQPYRAKPFHGRERRRPAPRTAHASRPSRCIRR